MTINYFNIYLLMEKIDKEILKFPCDYKIRVFGKVDAKFKKIVSSIVAKHTGKLHKNQISEKLSSKGSYISINIQIIAVSKLQLKNIENDLKSCNDVIYVL